MEQLREGHNGWESWDAVPRDGPAVFLVDAESLDRGQIRGEWIPLLADSRERRGQLIALAAATGSGRYAFVDQVGIAAMVPEQFGPEAVDDVLEQIGIAS